MSLSVVNDIYIYTVLYIYILYMLQVYHGTANVKYLTTGVMKCISHIRHIMFEICN